MATVRAVAFSPDGTLALTGAGNAETRKQPESALNAARLWDLATGKKLHSFRHTEAVSSVAFSPDGKQALSGISDKVSIWDVATGKEFHSFEKRAKDLDTTRSEARWLGFSSRGTLVLNFPDKAQLWDMFTDREICVLKDQVVSKQLPSSKKKGAIEKLKIAILDNFPSVVFSPDGKLLLTGTLSKGVRLWDAASGVKIRDIGGPLNPSDKFSHYSSRAPMCFSSDGKLILTGTDWDRAKKHVLRLWACPLFLPFLAPLFLPLPWPERPETRPVLFSCPQNRDDLIPTMQIQLHFGNRQAIQTFLRAGQTHGDSSLKIGALSMVFPCFFTLIDVWPTIFDDRFAQKSRKNRDLYIYRQTLINVNSWGSAIRSSHPAFHHNDK